MTGSYFLEGDWWEREGEVYNLHMKNKLKSEIFNNKNVFKHIKVFVITMNISVITSVFLRFTEKSDIQEGMGFMKKQCKGEID